MRLNCSLIWLPDWKRSQPLADVDDQFGFTADMTHEELGMTISLVNIFCAFNAFASAASICRPLAFGFRARLPEYLARWPNRELEGNRICDVLPHKYQSIHAGELHTAVTRSLHHRPDCLFVRHRKWTRTAGLRIGSRRWQELQHDIACHRKPWIVGAIAPNMRATWPPGLSALRMSRRPATGLAKNIVPKRAKTKSNALCGNAISASPRWSRTLEKPLSDSCARRSPGMHRNNRRRQLHLWDRQGERALSRYLQIRSRHRERDRPAEPGASGKWLRCAA